MRTRWWLILVLALATGVRLFGLAERVLWFDEAVTLLVARAAPADIVAAAEDETHPPGHYLILHFLPKDELAARGFSVVCGVLTVVFLIGCQLGSTGVTNRPSLPTWWANDTTRRAEPAPSTVAGVTSALLLALCPLHVWYSQEIRMYALQALLVTASWWLLLSRRWPGYAVVTALSLYTQYTSAFAIVAQGLYIVWCRRELFRSWFWAVAAAGVLFAPGVPLLARQYGGGTFGYWMKDFSWADPVRFFALLSGAIPKNPGPYWPWAVLSLAAVAVATWKMGTQPRLPLVLWLLSRWGCWRGCRSERMCFCRGPWCGLFRRLPCSSALAWVTWRTEDGFH